MFVVVVKEMENKQQRTAVDLSLVSANPDDLTFLQVSGRTHIDKKF